MNETASPPTVAVVVAALVIRTAVGGEAQSRECPCRWALASATRAVASGTRAVTAKAVAAAALGLVGGRYFGCGAVAWAALAGALAASSWTAARPGG
ncbi:hypothetical protein [Streptomyces wuyuanensis]|uniref:hypothetical protein n=1 Tax=Streptomyces wuyuanensis TaxID=1196353 RepID=UPI003D709E55